MINSGSGHGEQMCVSCFFPVQLTNWVHFKVIFRHFQLLSHVRRPRLMEVLLEPVSKNCFLNSPTQRTWRSVNSETIISHCRRNIILLEMYCSQDLGGSSPVQEDGNRGKGWGKAHGVHHNTWMRSYLTTDVKTHTACQTPGCL
jgi:hypothetical protein